MTPNPTPPPDTQTAPKSGSKLMMRLQDFATRYGVLAIVVHWTLFFICLGTFMALIQLGFRDVLSRHGFKMDGAAGLAGTFTAAYLACQVIKIPRFAATFALTPVIDQVIRRMRNKTPRDGAPPAA